MQKHIVFFANFLNTFPITRWRCDDAPTSGHRFKANRTNGVWTFGENDFFDRIGRALSICLPRQIPLGAIFKTMGYPHESRCKGPVLRIAFILSPSRKGTYGCSVVIAVAVEHFVFLAAIPFMRNLAHHLERLFIRFRTRITIIDARKSWHFFQKLFREECSGNGACRTGKIVELDQLIAHGIGDAFATVSNVYGPHTAGHRVQMFLAFLIPDPHSFSFDDNPWFAGFKRLVLSEVMPDVLSVELHNSGNIIFTNAAVHGFSS